MSTLFKALIIIQLFALNSLAQYRITGRVIDTDSSGIPMAKVRIWGVGEQNTDDNGFFSIAVSPSKQKGYFLKGGVDLSFDVEKNDMVILEPPSHKIRLPFNPDIQPNFNIVLCRKGSSLLIRNERMLYYIFQEKIRVAMAAKEAEFAQRNFLANEATKLGLSETEMINAIRLYKNKLQASSDFSKRGLASLYDAFEAHEKENMNLHFKKAIDNFCESIRMDELYIEKAKEAESRLAETYYFVAEAYMAIGDTDSFFVYIRKFNSLGTNYTNRLNQLFSTRDKLTDYSNKIWTTLRNVERQEVIELIEEYQQTLYEFEVFFGKNHPDVGLILMDIGEVLKYLGEYDSSLEYSRQALRVYEVIEGPKSSIVSHLLEEIGGTLYLKEDYDEALLNYYNALELNIQLFGKAHAAVAVVLEKIGQVYLAKGDGDSAMQTFKEAKAKLEDAHAIDYAFVSSCWERIGRLLSAQKKYDAALAEYQKAQTIYEKLYGPDHYIVAKIVEYAADVHYAKESYDSALENYLKADKIFTTDSISVPEDKAKCLQKIGHVYFKQSAYSEAIANYNKALEVYKHSTSTDYSAIAEIMAYIGSVHFMKGNHDSALKNYFESVEILEVNEPSNTYEIASRLRSIGLVLFKMGDYREALEHYKKALTTIRDNPPASIVPRLKNLLVGRILENVAEVHGVEKEHDLAYQNYSDAKKIFVDDYGLFHEKPADCMMRIGHILYDQGNYDDALKEYEKALRIYENVFGADKIQAGISQFSIGNALFAKGNYSVALDRYTKALNIYENVLGPRHPSTEIVRESKYVATIGLLPDDEKWLLQTQYSRSRLRNSAAHQMTEKQRLTLLNSISVGYIKQGKGDSAIVYLRQANALAKKLKDREMIGTVLNNFAAAYKSENDLSNAESYVRKSILFNRTLAGDSAAVLAYSYFHLSDILNRKAQLDSVAYYAQKSIAIARKYGFVGLLKEVSSVLEDQKFGDKQ